MGANLNLDLITPSWRGLAVEAFEQGDALSFLSKARRGNADWLYIVAYNASALRERGLYEAALLHAWTGTTTNHAQWPGSHIKLLFEIADKAKLRALGDPLPGPGSFTVYRGIAGTGMEGTTDRLSGVRYHGAARRLHRPPPRGRLR